VVSPEYGVEKKFLKLNYDMKCGHEQSLRRSVLEHQSASRQTATAAAAETIAAYYSISPRAISISRASFADVV